MDATGLFARGEKLAGTIEKVRLLLGLPLFISILLIAVNMHCQIGTTGMQGWSNLNILLKYINSRPFKWFELTGGFCVRLMLWKFYPAKQYIS